MNCAKFPWKSKETVACEKNLGPEENRICLSYLSLHTFPDSFFFFESRSENLQKLILWSFSPLAYVFLMKLIIYVKCFYPTFLHQKALKASFNMRLNIFTSTFQLLNKLNKYFKCHSWPGNMLPIINETFCILGEFGRI